jgi:hypothetical protein
MAWGVIVRADLFVKPAAVIVASKDAIVGDHLNVRRRGEESGMEIALVARRCESFTSSAS